MLEEFIIHLDREAFFAQFLEADRLLTFGIA